MHPYDDDIQDDDPTDELPVLTNVILGQEVEQTTSTPGPTADADDTGRFRAQRQRSARGQSADAEMSATARLQEDLDARNERLSALETELAGLQARWSEMEAALSERDAELSRLRTELTEREAAIAEQRTTLERSSDELRAQETTITELTSALELERDRAAALERNVNDLEQKLNEIEAEKAIAQESSQQVATDATVNGLREEVAALSQHIENRNAAWHEQAETLSAQSTRIQELEIEVAQRRERQLEAERLTETKAASARDAREKLREALEALKRSKSFSERPALPHPPAREAISDDVISDEDYAAQLRRELAKMVLVQAAQGDDAETLARLAEVETAIVGLENQMEPKPHEPKKAPPPEPAKLICLTTAELTEYSLDTPTVTIGRGASCDVQIGTHYVSREHARLTITDSGYVIEDLGSRNGVFVNAVKVERHDLEGGDLVTIGDTQFRYQAGGSG